jgi:hypothetical protein
MFFHAKDREVIRAFVEASFMSSDTRLTINDEPACMAIQWGIGKPASAFYKDG